MASFFMCPPDRRAQVHGADRVVDPWPPGTVLPAHAPKMGPRTHPPPPVTDARTAGEAKRPAGRPPASDLRAQESQEGRPRGSGSVQVFVTPSCVITSFAVSLPS